MNLFAPFRIRVNRGPFSRVILNAGWLTGARVAGDLANFVLFVVLSRRFGPSGIGKYAYGMAVGLLVYLFFNLGIEEYGIREYSRKPRGDRETFFGRLVTVQFLALLPILAGFAVFMVLSKPGPEIAATTIILTTFFIFTNIAGTFFIPAYSQQSMALPAASEFTCRVGSIVFSIWLVLQHGASLPIALLPLPAFGALQVLISCWSAIRRNGKIRFGIEWKEMKEMYRVAWPFAGSNLVFYIYSRLNLIIVSMMLGDAAAGYFFTGLKLMETGVLPLHLLGMAAYPILSQSFEEDGAAFNAAAEKLMRMDLIAGGLLVWILYFFVPRFLAPALGSKFIEAIPVVKGVAFLALLTAIETATIRVYFAMNLQAKRLRIQTGIAILSIAISLALISSYNVIGAVVSSILAKLLLIVTYFLALRRESVYRSLKNPLASFTLIFASAVCISGVLVWKTQREWLPAATFLVTFVAAIIGTGFIPIFHIGHRKEAINP